MNTVLHPCVTNPAGATTLIAATATGRSPIEIPLTTAAAFAAVQARTVQSTADPIMRVAREYGNAPAYEDNRGYSSYGDEPRPARPAESSRKSTPRDDRDKNSGLDWPYFLRSKKKNN